MKNILVLVHDDAGQDARLQAALDVAHAVDGHLNCLDVVIMPVVLGYDWSGYATAMLLEQERNAEDLNRRSVEARLAREDVTWSWLNGTGDIVSLIGRAAVLNELIVVNCRLDSGGYPDMRGATSNLIVNSGKPILAVPEKASGLKVAGHALVAWDGSPQSDAAIRAAIPLLRRAGSVSVVEIDDGSVDIPAGEAAAFLSRHGIRASIERRAAPRGEAGQGLLGAIDALGADYVVMGGFGHSRLSEALWGGVTRTLLMRSPVPLLLAH